MNSGFKGKKVKVTIGGKSIDGFNLDTRLDRLIDKNDELSDVIEYPVIFTGTLTATREDIDFLIKLGGSDDEKSVVVDAALDCNKDDKGDL